MRREKLCLCKVSIHAISAGQRMIPESNKFHIIYTTSNQF